MRNIVDLLEAINLDFIWSKSQSGGGGRSVIWWGFEQLQDRLRYSCCCTAYVTILETIIMTFKPIMFGLKWSPIEQAAVLVRFEILYAVL